MLFPVVKRHISQFKEVRPYKQGEEQLLGRMILEEGWDSSIYEVTSQLTLDPDGLLVAVDVNDRPLGNIVDFNIV